MNFDEWQQAWQSQAPRVRVSIDSELLLKVVRRNQEYFLYVLFWRDVREVGVTFLMALFFLYAAVTSQEWIIYPLGVACLWISVFMLADRWVQRKKQPANSDPLGACLEMSLLQVNHQIWLLRNVLWWYLLPPGIGLAMLYAYALWDGRDSRSAVLLVVGIAAATALVFVGLYWLNHRCVRRELEPRRRELEALLQSLQSN